MLPNFLGLLLLTATGLGFAAEVKQSYCEAYSTCRQSALNRLKSCKDGYSAYFFGRISTSDVQVDPLDRIHCEMSFKRAIVNLENLYSTIERNVPKCTENSDKGSIEDSQVLTCESLKIELPSTGQNDYCVKTYEEDLKFCQQLERCCPGYNKCYAQVHDESGAFQKERLLTEKYNECLAHPTKKTYLADALIRKALAATAPPPTEAPFAQAPAEEEKKEEKVEQVKEETKFEQAQEQNKDDDVKEDKKEQPQPEKEEKSEAIPPQEARQEPESAAEVFDDRPPKQNTEKDVDFKAEEPHLSFSHDKKTIRQKKVRYDEEEEDDEEEIIQLPLPEGNNSLSKLKPILQMNQTELEIVEKARVKAAIKELRDSAKKNVQKDVGRKEELTTEKKVIHNIMCSQFLECAAVVEKFDDDCEIRFPVDRETVKGIPNRHIRWHFLNTSTTTDAQIQQHCLNNVDPISQAQIEALQNVVNAQNEKCTRDQSVGRKTAEFDGCENVGLVNELVELAKIPLDEDPKLTNAEKQQKCKARHSDFGRRCRALRSCCPDTLVCDQTNQSKEAKELRQLKNSLKAEQRLCEARLHRTQKAAQSGLAGLAGLNL
ncbi:unnamed protein product [Bursaphelenchus xylophilus]|uniref:(pine wood nematode) hypothetical protein n=1 Tax=Bursaphelenchus xylophilus TaxID=6326 RepID=A0A1I7SWW0_BURXY|nr:unnamed protein product [Bursaphelenchus xylophilus]CAG9099994.1 unnamed protein product [Bursaphelenchus xylophilus]